MNLCYLCQACTSLLHSRKMLQHYLQVRMGTLNHSWRLGGPHARAPCEKTNIIPYPSSWINDSQLHILVVIIDNCQQFRICISPQQKNVRRVVGTVKTLDCVELVIEKSSLWLTGAAVIFQLATLQQGGCTALVLQCHQ